jgi:flagellar biosynthesis/type III secretory pathway M-ring protein FliF/YscJ
LFALLVLAFAAGRKRRKKARATIVTRPGLPSPADAAKAAIDDAAKQMEARLTEQAAMKQKLEAEALNALKISPVSTKKTEVLSKHIGEAAKKDPTSMVHVLRSWLNE